MKRTVSIIAQLSLVAFLAAGCGKKDDDKKTDKPVNKAGTTKPVEGDDQKPAVPEPGQDDAKFGLSAEGGGEVQKLDVSKAGVLEEAIAIVESEAATGASVNKPAIPGNVSSLMGHAPVEDKGDLKLVIHPGNDSEIKRAVAVAIGQRIDQINKMLKLPRDIPVILKPCGEPNAFWNPRDQQIEFCDEFAPSAAARFGRYKKDPAAIKRATVNVVVAAFLHELGHALIHQWKIPAVGRQEDAVDQLAAILLIAEGDDSNPVVMDFAEYWLASQIDRRGANLYWDEHSLDEQRFYNLACLVFGSNPDKYDHMVNDLDLPLMRARRCPQEYKDIKRAWEQLLVRFQHE